MEAFQPPTSPPGNLSACRRYLSLTLCFIECLLFTGAFFGWSSLVYVFKADGIYSHLCSGGEMWINSTNDNSSSMSFPTCDAQAEQLSLAFTLGLAMQGIIALPVGWIFDKAGLLSTRLLCWVAATVGFALLAFMENETSWMLYPGTALIATPAFMLTLTNCHVTQLAGKNTSIVTFLYNGAINSSSASLLFVKLCHDSGIPRVYSLLAFCGLWIIVLINTLFVLPRYKVIPTEETKPRQNDETLHKNEICHNSVHDDKNVEDSKTMYEIEDYNKTKTNRRNGKELQITGIKEGVDNDGFVEEGNIRNNPGEVQNLQVSKYPGIDEVKEVSLAQCVFSVMNITYLFWFACLYCTIALFPATFNMRVTEIVNGDIEKVSYYTDILGYTQMCAILMVPPAGLLTDWAKKVVSKSGIKGQRRAMAAIASILVTNTAAFTMGAALLVHSETFLYVSIIASEVFRSTVFATAIAFLEITWPGKYYGMLLGLAFLTVGASAMMQYPYIIWIQTYGFFTVDLFLLGTCCASLVLPIYIIIKHIKGNSQDRKT